MFNNVFRDPDSLVSIRKHQIDTLKIFNDHVTEVVQDMEYKVDFECGGREMSLSVVLGPKFPSEKPVLTLTPPVNHPWVIQSGEIISAPGLLNFTVHSDLGRVVQAVVREFELRPPPLLETVPPTQNHQDDGTPSCESSCGPLSPNSYLYSAPSSVAPYLEYTYNNTHLTNQPMSVTFPEINSLTVTELKELVESRERQDQLIDTLPLKQGLDKSMDLWITTVEKLARDNLQKKPLLAKLQEELHEKMVLLQQAKVDYDRCNAEYQKLCEKFNPHSIRESLRHSVVQIDEESEKVAEMFLAGNIDLDSFLNDYISHRMISYSRKAKDEKLSQQLEQLHQAGF